MKRSIKNSFFLIIVLTIFVLCAGISSAMYIPDVKPIDQCGENVFWNYDKSTGVMVISGTGDMYDNKSFLLSREKIKTVIIEEGVTSIAPWMFYGLDSLTDVTLPESLTHIGDYAFSNCGFEEISLPSELVYIGKGCFESAELTKIELPSGIITIEEFTFSHSKLKDIVFSTSLQSIEKQAFLSCPITKINLPSSLTYIGEDAFANSLLTEINIPENVELIGKNAFDSTYYLEKITVSENNNFYSNDDHGVLFDKNKEILIKYPSNSPYTEYTSPESVKTIAEFAFETTFNLKNVYLSEGLEKIEYAGFWLTLIEKMYLPESLKRLDDLAIIENVLMTEIYLASQDAEYGTYSLNGTDVYIKDISPEDFKKIFITIHKGTDEEEIAAAYEKLDIHFLSYEDISHDSVIYCHSDSSASEYAITNNVDYNITHFMNEWSYDYENQIKHRKCNLCDYTESEEFDKTENNDIENGDTESTIGYMSVLYDLMKSLYNLIISFIKYIL